MDSSDTAVPSVVSPAAEPQTTTVTDAQPVETVGIVSAVDDDTLTVISGDVDGKVAEVTLSSAEVLGVVDVAAAQYASQLPTISASRPNRTPTMTAGGTTYLDYFVETPADTNKGGITGITVKKGSQILEPGTSSIELMDGDKLSLSYTFNIPENALKDHPTPKTLTYKLPDGIKLTENKDFKLIDQSDGNREVGTGVVDTDGVVHLTFYNDFDTSKPFTGHFNFDAVASATGSEESSTIHFPTNLDLLVKLPRDLAIKKTGSSPFVDSDGTAYIDYTVTVSSKDGWSQPIEILDELQNNDTIAGEYVKDKFKLVKIDASNSENEVTGYTNTFETNSFHITNLEKLAPGESYRLTYRVKIIKNTATGDGYVEFQNKARSNNENDWQWLTSKFKDRIWKDGSYDPDTNTIKWTVLVKNHYKQNLKGSKVVDNITTEGALIQGNIKLEQVRDKDGNWVTTSIGQPFEPNADKKGFTYTFDQDAYGMEYKFTYVTSVPASTDGKQVTVHNDSTITTNGKDYTTGKDVSSYDRSWNFNKSTNGSLTATGENQYTAGWKLSSAVPNTWTEYTFVDQIKKPTYGEHYGIASELDQAIRDSLTFTNADNKTLSAKDAGITVEIDYYAESFGDANLAAGYTKISATNGTDKVHTFIIRLKNNGSYSGASPVKSMNVAGYSTHVDTTAVKAGAEFYIYNNDTWYYYKKNTDKTGLTKGVSTNNSDTHPYYGSRSSNYQPTATGDYKSDMEVYYELVLDVSSLKEFSPDKYGNYTVTVTDTLPNGLTFEEGSAKGFFGWSNWCQQNGHGNFTFGDPKNFKATREGQTVTFEFKNLDDRRVKYELGKPEGSRLTHLLVRYAATVQDPQWNNPKTVTETYTNTAKWGDNEAKATITLKRDLEYLTKSATYEALEDKNGNKTGQHVVHYSLDINPAYTDLLKDGDTVTLTDTLAVQDKNVTAHLDMDSVKLYDYPYVKGVSQPLPTTSYGMVYERTTDSNTGYDTHTMTFKLDDSRGYVLKYDYVLDSDDNVTLSNVAELTGQHRKQENTQITKLDASGSVSRSQFTLYKVDSLNPLTRLKGAEFTLSSYDGTNFIPHDGQSLHTTDANGEIVLYLGDNEKDGDTRGHFRIEPDTLYRLVETKEPDGYQMGPPDETTVYVIFANADSNETAAQAWEKTNKPIDLQQNKVVIVTGGQQKSYTVQNTRTWLTIQKFWQDKDGKAISGPEEDVTVHLYRYADGNSKENRDSSFDRTITLKKKDNWTYVFEDVEEGFFYYIEEASTGGKYDVTYSESNKTGVENGGLLTLTNKEIVGYELPSTGGVGTLPFTAVGGTMMLSALAYSFIHRKRRREGRADD